MKVVCTVDWSAEKIAPYGKTITAYLKKLIDRFPDDVTLESIFAEIMSGARQLWLVLDEDRLVAVCMTAVRTIDATGKKIVTLTSHAGEEGLSCVPEMCREIEQWAKTQGAHYTAAEGRRGWGRELTKQGYREYAVVWRKPVEGD